MPNKRVGLPLMQLWIIASYHDDRMDVPPIDQDSDGGSPADYRKREDSLLCAAGFEPGEDDLLWKRGAIWFGRQAALQRAWNELS